MIPLHDYLVAYGISIVETLAVCGALWLGISLLDYADKNRKQL